MVAAILESTSNDTEAGLDPHKPDYVNSAKVVWNEPYTTTNPCW